MDTTPITVKTKIHAPIAKIWQFWNNPQSVMQWNSASPDWHTPKATNDFEVGKSFSYTMAAKDGSMSFDFSGTYTRIDEYRLIEYVLGDGRNISVVFSADGDTTEITETFDPETQNPREMQQAGWQAMLDNFKKYAEEHA